MGFGVVALDEILRVLTGGFAEVFGIRSFASPVQGAFGRSVLCCELISQIETYGAGVMRVVQSRIDSP